MTGQLSRGDATVAPIGLAASARLLGATEDVAHWSPSPAPDGSRVAYVSDRGGAPQVWVQPADGPAILVDTGPEPVTAVSWSPDGAWLACVLAPGGAPRTEVWLVRPDGADPRQVAGFGAATAFLPRWVPGVGLAVTETDTCSRGVLVDPLSGDRRIVIEGALVALLDVSRDGRRALLRRGPRGARRLAMLDLATGSEAALVDGDLGCFSPDGSVVYARSDAGSELARLVVVAGTVTTLAERADAELESFALSADGATAALVWNVYGGAGELTLLDVATGTRHAVPLPGTVVSDCASASGDLAFTVEGPALPRTVHLGGRVLTEVTDDGRAAVPELRRLTAADGLAITGWLYRPPGPGPYPTVLSLHAGPEAQDRPGYNPLYQSLVRRGIAVFAPNVRGSSGFGRTFVNADNRHGRYGAISDVADCVAHLVDTGVAEAGRIGCMGRSYGGYLTLAALVTYPELFAAGVDVCGMSNFETFYARTEPWIAAAAVAKYGHPEHDRELLRDLSPIRRIDRLRAALLVVHGANDTNVPVHESEQVVAALRNSAIAHRYLLFDGEGHEFLSRANRETYVVAAVAWLAHHLRAHVACASL
jgi:dipeptidyl aminopeptidase/acylaminoacyl peptidase